MVQWLKMTGQAQTVSLGMQADLILSGTIHCFVTSLTCLQVRLTVWQINKTKKLNT